MILMEFTVLFVATLPSPRELCKHLFLLFFLFQLAPRALNNNENAVSF